MHFVNPTLMSAHPEIVAIVAITVVYSLHGLELLGKPYLCSQFHANR